MNVWGKVHPRSDQYLHFWHNNAIDISLGHSVNSQRIIQDLSPISHIKKRIHILVQCQFSRSNTKISHIPWHRWLWNPFVYGGCVAKNDVESSAVRNSSISNDIVPFPLCNPRKCHKYNITSTEPLISHLSTLCITREQPRRGDTH